MPIRPLLSSSQLTGQRQLSATTRLQLTTTELTNMTAPMKVEVTAGYAGVVGIYLSDSNATQIREVGAGQVHVFDEIDSPHKLWAKPSAIDGTAYLHWSCGVN